MTNLTDVASTPNFLATLSSPITNVTGDGTVYTAIWDTLSSGSGYNTSTGVFTAPISGDYLFLIMMYITNLSVSFNLCQSSLVTTFGTFQFVECNPGSGRNPSNQLIAPPGSIVVPMNVGDTASVTLKVSGSTKTVSFGTLSTFAGAKIL
jgi:hypothetical protein